MVGFFIEQINQGTRLFTLTRRAHKTDRHMHSHSIAYQNYPPTHTHTYCLPPPLCSDFLLVMASGMHLEPGGEKHGQVEGEGGGGN